MEEGDEVVAAGVDQEDREEYHGLVETLMELRNTLVEVPIEEEAPDGWIAVLPRRSQRNV